MKQTQSWKIQFLRRFKSVYDDMVNQTKTSINEIISQNMYIQNQLKLLQLNETNVYSNERRPSNNYNPRFDPYNTPNLKSQFQGNSQSYYKNDGYSSERQSKASEQSFLQNIRDVTSSQNSNDMNCYEPNFNQKEESKLQGSVKIENLENRRKSTPIRKANSGRIQDVPGNPIENRMVHQFFTNEVKKFIQIDGKKESQINKKQLLACYVTWRLKQLPDEKKMKLVAIQVIISSYIRANLKQCDILRHTYNGMKFKSFTIIKELKKVNLDDYKLYQRRGGRRANKKGMNIQQMGYQHESEQFSQQVKLQRFEDDNFDENIKRSQIKIKLRNSDFSNPQNRKRVHYDQTQNQDEMYALPQQQDNYNQQNEVQIDDDLLNKPQLAQYRSKKQSKNRKIKMKYKQQQQNDKQIEQLLGSDQQKTSIYSGN